MMKRLCLGLAMATGLGLPALAYTADLPMLIAPPDTVVESVTTTAPRVHFPRPLMRYVYRVVSYSQDSYGVQVMPGFVGKAGVEAAIAPMCQARGRSAVSADPHFQAAGTGGYTRATLVYNVHCQ